MSTNLATLVALAWKNPRIGRNVVRAAEAELQMLRRSAGLDADDEGLPRFRVDARGVSETYSSQQMLDANDDEPAFCRWIKQAKVGASKQYGEFTTTRIS